METGFKFSPDFMADKGFGGGVEKRDEEIQRRKQNLEDINTALAKVSPEARKDNKYQEYREGVDEAKKRLMGNGIDLDAYAKKDLQTGPHEENKIYGKRKGELRVIVEKMLKGEELRDEEREIAAKTGIDREDLPIDGEKLEEIKTEPKVFENKWEEDLALLERFNPKMREELRAEWIKKNWNNADIPFNVREEQLNKVSQPAESTEKKEDKQATIEKKDNKKAEEFTKEEEDLIIKECYDLVFVKIKNSTEDVKKSLFDISGVIASTLGRGKDPVISKELTKKIESLGIESWVNMRNVVEQWKRFKDIKEIDASTLTLDMFMFPASEAFFAHSKCPVPFEDANGKFTVVKEVDLQKEISKSMKAIRHHFASELKDDFGNPALVEYWKLVGDQAERARLYKGLKINKYVGEAAYSLLLSYQMLTDTSAEDFMSMMVDQADTRVKKYKISEERDPFVRMMIQKDLANGGKPFTLASGGEFFTKRTETAERLAELIPAKLIPTGLTGEGADHLEKGDWLKWRVDTNFYSASDLDEAKINYSKARQPGSTVSEIELQKLKDKIKPATDPGTRMNMMRSALTVLNLMKEIATDSSSLGQFESLKGRLYAHMTGSFGDAKWLGDNGMIPADFAFKENGVSSEMPLNEWISRTMMGMGKTFLYTHTIVDHKCTKPWDMGVLAENAEQFFRNEIQSTKGTFIGQQKEKWEEHRKEMLNFIDKMWDYSFELIRSVRSGRGPAHYPAWYKQGVTVPQPVIEVAQKAYEHIGDWEKRKEESRL